MLVRHCITHHPVMIDQNVAMTEARKMMVESGVNQLPVVDNKKQLLGLITKSHFAMSLDNIDSLDVWEISSKLNDLKVRNVMIKKKQVHTINSEATIELAAQLLTENDISCLPVIENEMVVGIITMVDLLRSYEKMLSLPIPGIRVTVRMPAQEKNYSELAKLITSIGDNGWGVMAIGTFPTPNRSNYYDVVVKIPDVTLDQVKKLIEKNQNQVIVDIREVG